MKRNLVKTLVFMLIVSLLAASAIYFADPQDMYNTPAEPQDKTVEEVKDVEI
ncbi:MAG: hypothetical protein K0R84_1912, partial [Clostridia bacterium]|nr:hypothetical protein [Clostridia bacterium]